MMSNIIVISVLTAIMAISGFLIYKSRGNIKNALFAVSPSLIILGLLTGIKFLLLSVVFIMCILIYLNWGNRGGMFKTLCITTILILVFKAALNIYGSSRMPIMLKASPSYIMDINQVKSSGGTIVKLKKVLMDRNSINVTYSVWGKEKVVALELKRNLNDEKPISEIPGLWVGGKILREHSFIGLSYDSKEFIDTLYLVFHLSDGSSVAFEVKDNANVGKVVSVIDINNTISYGGSSIKFGKFYRGLNYSSLSFESNFNPKDVIEISLIAEGGEIKKGGSSWSGDGTKYGGSYGFDPVNADKLKIKIKNFILNKEDTIDVNIR